MMWVDWAMSFIVGTAILAVSWVGFNEIRRWYIKHLIKTERINDEDDG